MIRWLQSRSIRTYAILFIMALVVLLGVINWLAYQKMDSTRQQIETRHQLAARAEIAKAVLSMQQNMVNSTQLFVESDETHQQLYDASYYAYWRDERVLNGSLLPKTVNAVALYDRHGKILDRATSADIPEVIKDMPALWVRNVNGRLHGYLVRQLYDGYSRTQRSGYALIRFDLMPVLREAMPFYNVATHDFKVAVPPDKLVTMDGLIADIQYAVTSNPDLDLLFATIARTLLGMLVVLVALSLVVYWLMMRYMATPLVNLSRHIRVLGDHSSREDAPQFEQPLYVIELENLRRSLNGYQHRLDKMHRRIDDKNQALWSMAHKDGLTGAFNRMAYDEDVAALEKLARTRAISVTLLLIDCDKFKLINDTYGHQVGDEVLITIVKLIQACLRGNDKLYRIGGDEFVVLLTEADADYGVAVGQRCLQAVADCDTRLLTMTDPLSVSIGIAYAVSIPAEGIVAIHKCADKAMYRAKQQSQPKLVVEQVPSMNS